MSSLRRTAQQPLTAWKQPAAANLQIINAITINALTLQFSQQNPWAPAFSTDNTVANFQLPFAFPVNIIQTATDITAGDPNQANRKRAPGDFATLDVPLLPSTTDVVARTLLLVFSGIPFQSIDDPIFSRFLLDTTQGVTKTFTLTGAADSELSLLLCSDRTCSYACSDHPHCYR